MSTTLDWISYEPITELGSTRAYFQIPAFSVTGLVWKGASEIYRQFNYSTSKNFTLPNRPTKPVGVNYVPCIRWHQAGVVKRYKLWDDDLVVLNEPLYAGELIKRHFSIEIWSINDGLTVASQNDAITLTTSILSRVTDFASIPANVLDATPATVTYAELQSPLFTLNSYPVTPPFDNLEFWYDPNTIGSPGLAVAVPSWADSGTLGRTLVQGSVFLQPDTSVSALGSVSPSVYPVTFNGTGDILATVAYPSTTNMYECWIVLRQDSWLANNVIFQASSSAGVVWTRLTQFGTTPNLLYHDSSLTSTGVLSTATLGTACIVRLRQTLLGQGIMEIYSISGALLASAIDSSGSALLFDTIQIGPAACSIGDVIGYNTAMGGAEAILMLQFLSRKYAGVGANTSLVFPEAGPFRSNP